MQLYMALECARWSIFFCIYSILRFYQCVYSKVSMIVQVRCWHSHHYIYNQEYNPGTWQRHSGELTVCLHVGVCVQGGGRHVA